MMEGEGDNEDVPRVVCESMSDFLDFENFVETAVDPICLAKGSSLCRVIPPKEWVRAVQFQESRDSKFIKPIPARVQSVLTQEQPGVYQQVQVPSLFFL